jgi:hypothetical protein
MMQIEIFKQNVFYIVIQKTFHRFQRRKKFIEEYEIDDAL